MQSLSEWIATHKAYVNWFHAAHHLTKGVGFAGDHESIYGKIYNQSFEYLDQIVERVIGLTNNETYACPHNITLATLKILQSYPSPANQPALAIAAGALHLNKEYLKFLEILVLNLKSQNNLSLGTEDFIAGLCNILEEYNYLLQQRTKEATFGVK